MTAPLVALWYKKGLSDSSHPLSPNRGAGNSTLASHEKTGQYRINSPSLPCKAGTWDLSGTAQYTVLGRDIGRDIDSKRGQCSAVKYSAVQYSAVQCIAVQFSAVQCGSVRAEHRTAF